MKKSLLAGASALALATFLEVVAHADTIDNTAKSAGSKVIFVLSIITLVVAVVGIIVGILKKSTRIQFLEQTSTKDIVIGFGVIIGILMVAMLVTWVYNTFIAAGGSLGLPSWPF